ncbi:hypothetical protein AGMMS49949_05710 [Alphaproteobacteria bacterium]|nr:hypothetical protein AGMMS49949_05710 [Alphaproteobacteria bacterium]GHS97691.1 hypothetical protein AGMMS50296_4880 [Alphaproteobacteria bacterium]
MLKAKKRNVNEQDLVFFENDLEIPAKELLFQCKTTDCISKWGRSLTQGQRSYVLEKITETNTSAQEQQDCFASHPMLFLEDYFVSQFALFKSKNLIQTVFSSTFKENSPLSTTNKFLQLLALFRFKKELLVRVQSFQKIQKRGWVTYDILYEKSLQTGSLEDFATCSHISKLLKAYSLKSLYCHNQANSGICFIFSCLILIRSSL